MILTSTQKKLRNTKPSICMAWFIFCISLPVSAMAADSSTSYEPNEANPYGLPNPEAPAELAQFSFLIGSNNCTEERLLANTGEWQSGTRTWDAYYFMNGFAIRDGGKSGLNTNSNIRIFDTATGQWQVTFFSMPNFSTDVWRGGLQGDDIVFEKPQFAPGTEFEGISRLIFHNISNSAFDWRGEWASLDGSIVNEFWRVSCSKN